VNVCSRLFAVSLFSIGLLNPGLGAADAVEAVSPPKQQIVLKRKVAIARFSNETRSGNSFLVSESGDRVGKQASDILSAKLTETGLFLLFERIDSDKVNAEQILAGITEAGISVDYLIVGSVSEFGRSNSSDTGVFSRKKEQKAYAKVNVRLIEVKTGRVILAEEGAGESITETKKTFGVGSSAGYDQSLTDKAISAAISQLMSRLVENMTATPWKSYVLGEEAGMYVIAGGPSQGLMPGVQLAVYQRGGQIKNPQTGGVITLPGRKVAEISVVSSFGDDEFNEGSLVTLVSGEITGDLVELEVREQ
jgi:curli biogenesis system outer membrane secretion channel CsgG